MALTTDFDFTYQKDGILYGAPSVTAFSVEGGATRTIRKNSDHIMISSEFEQARKFKNIVLFLSEHSEFGSPMRTAVDLMHFATTKSRFYFQLNVWQQNNSTITYKLLMEDENANVAKPPRMTVDNVLRVEFSLPKLAILYSKGGDTWTRF